MYEYCIYFKLVLFLFLVDYVYLGRILMCERLIDVLYAAGSVSVYLLYYRRRVASWPTVQVVNPQFSLSLCEIRCVILNTRFKTVGVFLVCCCCCFVLFLIWFFGWVFCVGLF